MSTTIWLAYVEEHALTDPYRRGAGREQRLRGTPDAVLPEPADVLGWLTNRRAAYARSADERGAAFNALADECDDVNGRLTAAGASVNTRVTAPGTSVNARFAATGPTVYARLTAAGASVYATVRQTATTTVDLCVEAFVARDCASWQGHQFIRRPDHTWHCNRCGRVL